MKDLNNKTKQYYELRKKAKDGEIIGDEKSRKVIKNIRNDFGKAIIKLGSV